MQFHKYIIIGAGATGLGAAHRLRQLGATDFCLLEQNDYAGGLATSFTDEKGFLWDIGGHVQFSHYTYFDALMRETLGEDGWLHHQRESWVWLLERFVPYPFQNNIRHLPKAEQWACLQGLLRLQKNPPTTPPQNFAQWVSQSFGEGLADVFMRPYNFKVWAHPLELMSFGWIGERVAMVDVERVLGNIYAERDDVSWGPNSTFQFPKHGGTGAIWKKIAENIGLSHFRFDSRVARIDAAEKVVYLQNGEALQYEFLLSTMPVDKLTQTVSQTPEDLRQKANQLRHSATNIVGVGLHGQAPETLKTKCWLYFPEDNCPFYRTTVFSNYSPYNVPDSQKYWSLMTETSESEFKPVDTAQIVEQTIEGLLNCRLISSREQIASTWHYRAEYGYPTPSVERDEILNAVLPFFEAQNIYSRGRFGSWKYEISNQDHSLMLGVEWANRILLDVPEITLRYPNIANNGAGRY
jgi:protoporphyrinogen oxidase